MTFSAVVCSPLPPSPPSLPTSCRKNLFHSGVTPLCQNYFLINFVYMKETQHALAQLVCLPVVHNKIQTGLTAMCRLFNKLTIRLTIAVTSGPRPSLFFAFHCMASTSHTHTHCHLSKIVTNLRFASCSLYSVYHLPWCLYEYRLSSCSTN